MTLFVNLGRAGGRKFRAPPQRGAAAAGPGRARLGEGMGGGEARRYIQVTLIITTKRYNAIYSYSAWVRRTIAVAPMDLARGAKRRRRSSLGEGRWGAVVVGGRDSPVVPTRISWQIYVVCGSEVVAR